MGTFTETAATTIACVYDKRLDNAAEIAAFRFFTGDEFRKTSQTEVDGSEMHSILSRVLI